MPVNTHPNTPSPMLAMMNNYVENSGTHQGSYNDIIPETETKSENIF
jgi:hypothetical protein